VPAAAATGSACVVQPSPQGLASSSGPPCPVGRSWPSASVRWLPGPSDPSPAAVCCPSGCCPSGWRSASTEGGGSCRSFWPVGASPPSVTSPPSGSAIPEVLVSPPLPPVPPSVAAIGASSVPSPDGSGDGTPSSARAPGTTTATRTSVRPAARSRPRGRGRRDGRRRAHARGAAGRGPSRAGRAAPTRPPHRWGSGHASPDLTAAGRRCGHRAPAPGRRVAMAQPGCAACRNRESRLWPPPRLVHGPAVADPTSGPGQHFSRCSRRWCR